MGFIREPEGIDFVIAPSPPVKEDIAYISSCIRQHKENDKAGCNAKQGQILKKK